MTAQKTINVVNGVDTQTLSTVIESLQKDPALAKSNFRIKNRWVSGGQNQSIITDFYTAGQNHLHNQLFCLEADEPQLLAGGDGAASPVEHLLHALASCLTTSLVYHAASRGIEIQQIESRLEGNLDIRGFLGLSDEVRKGFDGIKVSFKIKTDDQNIEKIKELAKYSPVFDMVSNPTPVDIQIERM